MALPKIKSPIYELTLHSTKQSYKYRPFLVKEQKILLMALESQDPKEMLRAIKQIITNCSVDEIDVDKLPMFDLEYFFLRLRGKSIGEEIELKLTHPTGLNSKGEMCEFNTPYKFNIMDVEVEVGDTHTNKILLDEESGVGVVLKYPTMSMADKLQANDKQNQFDVIQGVVVESIDYIFDNENTYPASESTKAELVEFINGLSQEQFAKITEFFNTMPKLRKVISWTCPHCGCDDKVELEGMTSFFG
jgi:hypothetical protein